MSATNELTVKSRPTKMPVEILDSTSEIGRVFENYMAHFAKLEIESRYAALEAFFRKQKEEAKQTGSRSITYSNIGKTPQAITATRATNQRDSALLKLPAELLINIWKTAFGSTTTARVHGMVCRDISENRILSLVHACSLLHEVLYPTFLSQEAFVVKTSSSDPSVAASELTQWLGRLPFASVLNGPIKITILLELHVGCLPVDKARELAAEVQAMCSASRTFQPMVYVEGVIGWGWYFGPDANVQVWSPVTLCHDRVIGRPTEQDDVWKGWVVTKWTLNA
jgi:hypothetical protein